MRTRCWMTEETHGAFCLGCGCCSEDLQERYESRIQVLEERVYNLETKARDYEYDYESTRLAGKKFYSQVNIEKTEDEIQRLNDLIRCYRSELNKLRKR